MTADTDFARLQRQVADAAKRLNRTADVPVLIAAVVDLGEGATGVGFAVHGLTNAQHERAHFMLLSQLAEHLQPGAVEGCPDCSAAWARVSAAVEALRPPAGSRGHAHHKGCC